ncbi:MAG: hypothetical protein ACJ8MR_13855 [Povalibacter sp.]
MSSRQSLEIYVHALLKRARTLIVLRALAVLSAITLALVLLIVWWLQRESFASNVVLPGRIALLAVSIVVVWLLAGIPLRRLTLQPGAELERRLPAQRGRVQTFLDVNRQAESDSPLTELLARDALSRAEQPPEQVVRDSHLWTAALIAALALGVLSFLLIMGPAHWGYGSRYLLLGSALPRSAVPILEVNVTPGDVTVRRNSDLTLRAVTQGFDAEGAEVFVRFDDQQNWERAPMQMVNEGARHSWQFKLFAVRGPLHYYVEANARRATKTSAQHAISVVDLPRIERVRLTYHYPKWTGLADHLDDIGRKIRAVQGTQVSIEVFADAPLHTPVIAVGERNTAMQISGQAASGRLEVEHPGSYHISSRVADEWVALTEDYPIEIIEDTKPSIEIKKPGRDWQATSIEEVPVSVQAHDDFNLQQVALRYSVNGGEWQTLPLPAGARETDADSLLRLEDIGARESTEPNAPAQLQPGDLVTYYGLAKDRQHSVQTDLFMVQVQPFERHFSEGQSGGGGGAMGDDQGAISERQREILLATWNLLRGQQSASRSRSQVQESASMLAEMQTKLAAQAHTLAERMRARTSVEDDERVQQFVESLDRAAAAMEPAAKNLESANLQPAIPVEQQALQHLLRAEAAFRDVQVAMQKDSARGGQQAARNFTEMFELEMDVDKNHYETQSPLSERNDRDELDETIRKLKELAERQERLAQQMNRSSMSAQEQRWRQEQLRREAEDLERRLSQMQASSAQNSPSQQDQSGSSSEGQRGEGQRSEQEAVKSMRAALENMRRASGSPDNQESTQRSAQDAGRDLRQALQGIQRPREDTLAQQAEQMADRARGLSQDQQRVESELYQSLGAAMNSARDRGQLPSRQAQKLVEAKQRMADELSRVQQDMRAAINDHRSRSPEATRRLAQALSELEDANLAARLNRSAAEIRYGRAREAAPREGLIADALKALEENLRATARVAAGEKQPKSDEGGAEQLLSQLAELRKSLQQNQGASAGDESRGSKSNSGSSPQNGSERASGEQRGNANVSTLAQWTPDNSSASRQLTPSIAADDAQGIGQQLEDMATRGESLGLTAQQIEALRRLVHQAKQIKTNATARLNALALVDQLELSALSQVEKSSATPPARTSVAPDEAEQREVLAEYFRRLGARCAAGEGGAC